MLMSPVPEVITGRGQQLLDAIRAKGDWISRAELGRASGKRRLSPHDLVLLDRMVNAGLLEKRERASNTPIGTAFEYRVKA